MHQQSRPGHQEMLWIKDFGEADEILKSKLFYSTLSLGPSAPIMAETLISLHGDEHTYRRRTEILMFSRPALVSYELQLVRPALRTSLARMVSETGSAKVPILDVMRFALLRVSARIVGLDDVDTEEATDDEVLQQAGVIGGGEAVRSAADEREDEAEEDVGADYLRRQQ